MTTSTTSKFRRRIITAAAVAGVALGGAGIANAAIGTDSTPASDASAVVALQTDDTIVVDEADNDAADHSADRTEEVLTGDVAAQVTVTFDEDFALVEIQEGRNGRGQGDGHGGGSHGSEEALTGDVATRVTAAAEAAVPGGTIERVETDDGGATYEAHMVDVDGNEVTVTFDEDFVLVEIQQGR